MRAVVRNGGDFARQVLTWALVLALSFPLFWLISTALRPDTELFVRPPHLLPKSRVLFSLGGVLVSQRRELGLVLLSQRLEVAHREVKIIIGSPCRSSSSFSRAPVADTSRVARP